MREPDPTVYAGLEQALEEVATIATEHGGTPNTPLFFTTSTPMDAVRDAAMALWNRKEMGASYAQSIPEWIPPAADTYRDGLLIENRGQSIFAFAVVVGWQYGRTSA